MSKAKSIDHSDIDSILPLSKAVVTGRIPSIDSVVNLMPGFVYVFNHTTFSNDYSNKSVASHLGYSSVEIRGLGNDMFMRIVHKDDHAGLAAHMARIATLENDETAVLEYRVITKEGDQRWLRSVDAVFDRGPDGQVLRHIGCASDITDEKEAQLRLKVLNAELEEKVAERTLDLATLNAELEQRIYARTEQLQDAVDELEQLTYIATHDLKVPLNNLHRLGLMLEDCADSLSADQAEQVHWINQCCEQLSTKVKSLVLVSQIRLGSAPPKKRLGLRHAVLAAVNDAQIILGEQALSVECRISEEITVDFAEAELTSILSSVLDNAMKYADADRPLQVMCRAGGDTGQTWLSISDNGTGVDTPRDTLKVFGLFQRAHKLPVGGGVSLYCAQRMLRRCGGDMTVSGQRGKGAEFKMTFPMEKVAE